MADVSLLYSIQNDIFVAMKKINRNLKTEKACNKTQNYFEKHVRDLETLWKDFTTNHEKLKTAGKNKRDLYFRSNMYVIVEGLYKTTRGKLHQMHQYYKLTKFPDDAQESSQIPEIQETQEVIEKQEIDEISIDQENSDMDTEMNPVKLLENSDVATITDCAVMNMEEQGSGVEFLSVELLLNELSAQTPSKKEDTDGKVKSIKEQGNIDLSMLEQFDEQPDRKVLCPINGCGTLISSKDRMIRHLRVHNGEMPFQCNYCDYATYNSTRIQEHINTHSGIKPYKCSFCEYCTVSKKYLKQHEAKHCKCHCGYISKNRVSLQLHQQEECIVVQEKNPCKYTCGNCKRGFSTKVSSRTHKQERGRCSVCDDLVCDLRDHMEKLHGQSVEIKQSQEVKIKYYKFACKMCGWKGKRELGVLLHLIHHPQPVDIDIDVSILKKYKIL